MSDVIIRGGLNLSAAEIEERLAAMPGVAEVAVVAAPDERLGEHACAVVRVAPDVASIDLESVRAHLASTGPASAEVARGGARHRRLRPHPVRQDQEALPARLDPLAEQPQSPALIVAASLLAKARRSTLPESSHGSSASSSSSTMCRGTS